ncbi:MAG: pentapeptide repeat-containing protein [Roseobacter sp.]
MSNFFSIEFLPIMAIPIFGFILTFKSTRTYVKWIFAAAPVLLVIAGIYSEYRCDRSLTNIVVRMVKGIQICPQNTAANDEFQPNSPETNRQNSRIITAQAWFVVGQKVPGGSGKAAALEVLAQYNEPLQGLDISCQLMGSGYDPSRRRYPCDTLTQLNGLDLSQTPSLDMSEVNFEGIRGEGIDLSSQDLTHSNLSFSHIPNSNFNNAKLSMANLSGSEVFSTNFENAELSLAQFEDSNISSSEFAGANMGSASLMRTYAASTNFSNANLRDANFDQAEIRDTQFNGANLFRSSFREASIVRTTFSGAQLSLADFTGANINMYDEVSSDFLSSWAWRGQEPTGLGRLAGFVTICNFDANIHDIRFRPSDC